MNIGIIGSDGFVGHEVVKKLDGKYHKLFPINRLNYLEYVGMEFDILINCNGNSKKFWANNHPKDDFYASTVSVHKSLFDFQFNKYIYISSFDAMQSNYYGFHKYLAEQIIMQHTKIFLILRCSAIIGPNMKKGIMYDILKENIVYLTPDSRLKFISVTALASLIDKFIDMGLQKTHYIGSHNAIKVSDIGLLLNKKINYSDNLRTEDYDIPTYYVDKSAEEYIQEIIS